MDYSSWIYATVLALISHPNTPQVVSISYATAEVDSGDEGQGVELDNVYGGYTNYIQQSEIQLAALTAMGTTVIAASGDNGANGDYNPDCVYTGHSRPSFLYVSWPASSPHVVAVGATSLNSAPISTSESSTPWCGLQSTNPPSGYTYDSGFEDPFTFACITGGTEVAVNSNFARVGASAESSPLPHGRRRLSTPTSAQGCRCLLLPTTAQWRGEYPMSPCGARGYPS